MLFRQIKWKRLCFYGFWMHCLIKGDPAAALILYQWVDMMAPFISAILLPYPAGSHRDWLQILWFLWKKSHHSWKLWFSISYLWILVKHAPRSFMSCFSLQIPWGGFNMMLICWAKFPTSNCSLFLACTFCPLCPTLLIFFFHELCLLWWSWSQI